MSYAKAIENLYAAFADVPRPTEIEGCHCCINEEEIVVLLQKPLRDLSGDDLGPLWYSSPSTVGTWENYCYFFPRLLEVSLDLSAPNYHGDPELLLCRLDDNGREFGNRQLEAVSLLLWERWKLSLEENAERFGGGTAETLFACLFLAKISPEKFLYHWLAVQTVNSVGQLAIFIRFNWEDILKGGVWNAFLDDEHTSFAGATERKAWASATMREWLSQPVILERLLWLEEQIRDDEDYSFTLESTQEAIKMLEAR